MEKILTKALDEALTDLYANELRSLEDTGYKFSPEFEYEMRKLIKRTDRPIYMYTGYIAAAACAVIAVGSAVLIPLLTDSGISVHKPEETTASTTAPVSADSAEPAVTIVSSEITETTSAPETSSEPESTSASETTVQSQTSETTQTAENTVSVTETATAEPTEEEAGIPTVEIATKESETTAAPVVVDNSSPDDTAGEVQHVDQISGEETEEAENEPQVEAADDEPAVNDEENLIIADDDNDDVVLIESEEDIEEAAEDDEDDDYNGDWDDDYDDEDDDFYEGDDFYDGDDDDYDYEEPITDDTAAIDDTEIIDDEESDESYDNGQIVYIKLPHADTFGELIKDNFGKSFESLYAYSFDYYEKADGRVTASTLAHYSNCEFMHDFVHSLGEAKSADEPTVYDGSAPKVSIYITDAAPVKTQRTFYNGSDWKHYAEIYGGKDWEDEIIDDDAYDEEDYTFDMRVDVYKSGLVRINGTITGEGVDEDGSLFIYKGSFNISAEKAKELISEVKGLYIPSDVTTVGDIADAMNITAANIGERYVSVSGVYDTRLTNADISPAYIAEIFSKYATKRVAPSNSGYLPNYAEIDFSLKDSEARLSVRISANGTCVVKDLRNTDTLYEFGISDEEIIDALIAVNEANKLSIPIYDTLSDFLKGKNFNTITEARNGSIILTDASELKKLKTMITEEAKKAKYLPTGKTSREATGEGAILIFIKGYQLNMTVRSDDTINLGGNIFECEEGFYNKVKSFIDGSSKQ